MAIAVEEVMNREVFCVRSQEPVDDILGQLLALGITAAPVVDADGRPLGMVSLRDLAGARRGATAFERMTRPVISVAAKSGIQAAANLLAEAFLHRLIVTDEEGRVVGVVSSVDLLRGVLGLPVTHPPAFPHHDARHGVVWTDERALATDRIDAAPDGAGVLVLIHGEANAADQVVWAEGASRVRARLRDLVTFPQEHIPALARWLEKGSLRFRAASVPDRQRRARIVASLLYPAGGAAAGGFLIHAQAHTKKGEY